LNEEFEQNNKRKQTKTKTAKQKMDEVKLRVVEALQEDAYKGIARIDSSIMRKLSIRPGDVVSVSGERQTVAIADRAYPADIGEGIIRIDGIIRRNAKTSLGEYVTIKKVKVFDAKKVTIAPARKDIMVEMSPEVAKRGLLGRAVLTGDILVLGGTNRRRDIMENSFEEIMNIFGEQFGSTFPGFGSVRFIVASTQPKAPVRITDTTLITVSPKALEVTEEKVPDVTYEDIGGLDDEIKKIREMVELPLKHPEVFSKLGIEPPRGILLYGPPGTGKTLLAKAVANESEANFIHVAGPSLISKWVGESEKAIRQVFNKARQVSPCIIFFDEVDSIASRRGYDAGSKATERMLNQLLNEMDGLQELKSIVVIAATNRPDILDPALLRPGRFDRILYVDVPDEKSRVSILKIHTKNMPLTKDVNINEIAKKTNGFVGADIASLCKEAAMIALRENKNIKQVSKKHFDAALKKVAPSVTKELAKAYKDMEKNYLRSAKAAVGTSYTG